VKRRGLDALLDTVESLQGAPLAASLIETEILPSRLTNYQPGDLDTLIAAGEVVWAGVESLGERDGRVALFLAERMRELWTPRELEKEADERERKIVEQLASGGAVFFAQLHEAVGAGYPGETLDALWNLVWRGVVTNDTFHALRAYTARPTTSRPTKRVHNVPAFRSRRTTSPTAQGRWSLVTPPGSAVASVTTRSHAMAQQLLSRYGVLTREVAAAENLPGGFSAIYDVLKALEESGRVRRGYFVAGLGATQFAMPAALDLLRSLRSGVEPEKPEMVAMAATDPANPYGSVLKWPSTGADADETEPTRMLSRSVGASVILRNGTLVAYLRRGNPSLQVFLPAEEPMRSNTARDFANFLVEIGQREMRRDERGRGGVLVSTINGAPVAEHFLARFLLDAGFQPGAMGFNLRRALLPVGAHVGEAKELQ